MILRIATLFAGLLFCAPCAGAADTWLPVREISLELSPGSPLDFSALVRSPASGEMPPLVINSEGQIAAADEPQRPARLLCASLGWSPASGGFPDHATADRYARQLRMHGYGIARFHFVDAALMNGRNRDFDFDPDVLDRVYYLMAALKRNGIYWIVDGLTSQRAALAGYGDRWDGAGDMKLSVLIDESGFAHWLQFQKLFLTKVNPYTGIAPIRDPALAAIVPMNENGLEFDSIVHEGLTGTPYPQRLRPAFNAWLSTRYGSTEALSESWRWIGSGQRLENGTIDLPSSRQEKSPRMRDLQAFFIDVERGAAERMTKALRDLGYRGIVMPYNNWPSLQTSLSRQTQQAVAMNTYQDWVASYAPGTAIQATSSLEDGALYMRTIAASRWLGRPFVLTEYDHLFWSPYRYEAGIVMPAYAALQNWDTICRHAHGPIILGYGEDFPHKRQMLPYAIALDPVARAGETLSALLFERGDVKGSPTSIPFLIDGEKGLTDSTQSREPESLTRLALVGAVGLRDANVPLKAQHSPTLDIPADRSAASIDDLVAALRQDGRLSDGNDTNLDGGIAESDTGEIRLDANTKQITVRTERTEAIAYASLPAPVHLDTVTVLAADTSGLFSLSSLDDAPLRKSRRILTIFATDARNSDMRFQDSAERVINDFGHLPVLVRKGEVRFSLANTGGWRISPIGLDGVLRKSIASGSGDIDYRLSNDTPDGPTTYFLIERLSDQPS